MLLDSQLVERFHALHRQHLSGCLTAQGEQVHLTICLVEGEPVAIDLHRDLEQAFADACREYHKLDDAALSELRAAMAGGAKARTYLLERQLVSEAEADQVAQAVVEDALTRGFRGPCTNIVFEDGKGPETLPVGRSALKMRIGVEALIKTCDQRVNDLVVIEREIPNWNIVFSLSEGDQISGQLTEYEKLVLNFIDGHSTVEQIAELYGTTVADVRQNLNVDLNGISADAREMLNGEFFYQLEKSDDDGFFLTEIPSGVKVKITCEHDPEYVPLTTDATSGSGFAQEVGPIVVYQR